MYVIIMQLIHAISGKVGNIIWWTGLIAYVPIS